MAEPQWAIEARGLRKEFGAKVAVAGADLTVPPGEVFGFLGPNGAGKTTTGRMLTGQSRPHGGQAVLLGLDVVRHREEVQAQIGVCFEVTNLYEQMSALENLRLFGRLYGVRDLDAEGLLERVGLGGRGRERAAGYSKGMKQRLMVARALVHRPRILFLDEPTEGLDPVSAEAIRNLILEERARGATIFLTTHDMLEADRLCDRVAFISHGEIAALDTPHALKQRYGQRLVEAEVQGAGGLLERREIPMDGPEAAEALRALFAGEQVVTIHSREASLEDIFIQVTGRGLA